MISFVAGGLFGLGLLVSGMTDTTRVQGWLDLFGNWDPTLAFVLGGAIVPMFIAWRVRARMAQPLAGDSFPPPPRTEITAELAVGSALFGLGWGLTGLCPGPALASLSFGGWEGFIFLVTMALGMIAAPPARRRLFAAHTQH